jgi:hypothetical protein
MADYYPLISRAVAGLEKNNGENRRALYERARAALIAQLRGVNPPLPETDITRERLALEESIRKVEAEAARQFDPSRPQSPGPKPRLSDGGRSEETPRAPVTVPPPPSRSAPQMPRNRGADFDRWEDSPPVAAPPQRPAAPYPSRAEAPVSRRPPPMPMPSSRYNDAAFEPARSVEPVEAPSSRHPLRRSLNDRRTADAGVQDLRDLAEASELGAAAARAAPSARDNYPPLPPPPVDFERRDSRVLDPPPRDQDLRLPDDFQEPMLEPSFTAEETRPAGRRMTRQPPPPVAEEEPPAKRHALRPKRSARDWIKSAAVLLIVAGLGGVLLWQWPNAMALYQNMRTPAVSEVRDVPAAGTRSTKINDRIEPGVQPGQGAADTAATPGAAVAQKVVLYEEDPADPNGKRFVGSAIWRTETISPGPGQPPELAIRADVDIPDRKLAMTWSLRRNTDQSLPASHTVEISFKLPSDFPSGGISNVPGILMKQAEQTRGVPLAGLAVKVTSGFFLIGLSAADSDRDRNMQLLKERAWFDIPVVYNNNRRAILAIEKGTPGDRVFAEAFKTWKQ